MPSAIDPKKKPAEVLVHVSSGAGVDIKWTDGHSSHYAFDYLRDACPCASCNDERRKREEMAERISGSSGGPAPVLPIFKPKPRARAAKAIGHYALQIDFTDGHSTGIYSFDYLRELCPCDVCRAERAR